MPPALRSWLITAEILRGASAVRVSCQIARQTRTISVLARSMSMTLTVEVGAFKENVLGLTRWKSIADTMVFVSFTLPHIEHSALMRVIRPSAARGRQARFMLCRGLMLSSEDKQSSHRPSGLMPSSNSRISSFAFISGVVVRPNV